MEAVKLEHVPGDIRVFMGLFRDVRNAGFLQGELVARNSAFEYAFLDAGVIISRTHILAAVYKAITAYLANSLRTPNIHSEVVTCFNNSNNIVESYRRFGISPSTTNIIAIKILLPKTPSDSLTEESIRSHLTSSIEGDRAAVTDEVLATLTDWPRVRKYYKLNGLSRLDKLDERTKKAESEVLVLGAMALKGA